MQRIIHQCRITFLALWAIIVLTAPAWAAATSLESILDGLETKFDQPGFAADFSQESTVKSLEITDIAKGRLMVKKPGHMRWEYTAPEPQLIISDGQSLWIYRPADKQVLIGKAPKLFGDGKGAGFLADIKVLRRKFDVTLMPDSGDRFHYLRLVPLEKTLDIAQIELVVDKQSGRWIAS